MIAHFLYCIEIQLYLLLLFLSLNENVMKWSIARLAKALSVKIYFEQSIINKVVQVKEIYIQPYDFAHFKVVVPIIDERHYQHLIYADERGLTEDVKEQIFINECRKAISKMLKENPQFIKKYVRPDDPYSYRSEEQWIFEFWTKEVE